jgi:beta-N-acetylhexosaminidase
VAVRASEASVTLVKDTAAQLPLSAERTLVLAVEAAAVSAVDEAYASRATLGRALAAQGVAVTERNLPLEQLGEHAADALQLAAQFNQIVVGTYNANFYPEQIKLVQDLLAMGKQPIVVALRNPYDIQCFPEISTYVCLYESRPIALQSVAKFLTGQIPARGKLPVTIDSAYPAGWGVTSL